MPGEHLHDASEHHPTLTKTEARQGQTGMNVRYVLGFGLAGVAVAFFLICMYYFT